MGAFCKYQHLAAYFPLGGLLWKKSAREADKKELF
jgi:hypothetical protein